MMKEGRKRKRAPHHTACQECHRLHRSCDGGRPCRRCVAAGKEDVCQPIQRKPYTRKPKPSVQWLSQQAFSIFNQPSNQLPIKPFEPSSPFPSVTSHTEVQNQRLLTELLQQVQQVQQMTQSLQLRQQLLTHQLISLKPSQPLLLEDRFDELLDAQSSSPDMSSPTSSSPLLFDSPIQLFEIEPTPELASSDTHQEMLDLIEVSHDPNQDLAFPVPHDVEDFKESLFVPFAITDAAKVPAFLIHQSFFNVPPPQILSHFMWLSSQSTGISSLQHINNKTVGRMTTLALWSLPFCPLIYPSARCPNIKRYSISSLLIFLFISFVFLSFISLLLLFRNSVISN